MGHTDSCTTSWDKICNKVWDGYLGNSLHWSLPLKFLDMHSTGLNKVTVWNYLLLRTAHMHWTHNQAQTTVRVQLENTAKHACNKYCTWMLSKSQCSVTILHHFDSIHMTFCAWMAVLSSVMYSCEWLQLTVTPSCWCLDTSDSQ